jgi:hypothetical protein
MMQATLPPSSVREIVPGECLLASYVSCDYYSNPKCPQQDPRNPPIGTWRPTDGRPNPCDALPELCPTAGQPWVYVWECISATVTTTGDCYYDKDGNCIIAQGPGRKSKATVQWFGNDTVCYPDFIIGPSTVDPNPPTNGGFGPHVSVVTPADRQTVSGIVHVDGAATQAISGAGKIAAWLDGIPIQLANFTRNLPAGTACSSSGQHDPNCPNVGFGGDLETRTLPNGAHRLQIWALDSRSGYPAPTYLTRSFITSNSCSDITPPSVAVSSPTAGATVGGVITISVAATDNIAVTQASLYVDGTIVAVFSAPPYSYSWNTTTLAAGRHTLQARAADGCGNTAASSTIAVNVLAPIRLYIDAPPYSGTVSGPAFGIVGWATDPYRITALSFALDGQPLALNAPYNYGRTRTDVCNAYPGDSNCPRVGWSAGFDSTRLSNGAHTLAVTATDGAGQQATAFWPVTISNAAPPAASQLIWIQTQASAGYGPPGSLIVAGHATGGSPGAGVQLWWRDVTAGQTNWSLASYAPPPDSNGIWVNAIPSVNYNHVYTAVAIFSGAASNYCTYQGNSGMVWCP